LINVTKATFADKKIHMMQKILVFLFNALCPVLLFAQLNEVPKDTAWKNVYRATPEKINTLVHTKIDVRFNYEKAWLYGKVWLTLKPYFYATDSVKLDAKGMEIKEVAMMKGITKTPLKYNYDGYELNIHLGRRYQATENYIIYVDYISKPNEFKVKGSAAITDAKGLYFINPLGEAIDKPIQIWTQGETEATSVWVPIIDKTNQKTTQEIYMTVPAQYVTLSNGLLTSQKKNTDGTRTDYWKMDLPHSPYLFFMAVGDYKIIKDSYKGKEVSYYVEPAQAPYAKGVFGLTPEMMKFFSDKLGVEYPWQKYSQIVGRDYVSGAMENTTSTLHQESAYQNARQLTDGNGWESTIAHELFHHWFGDYVTAESWSNLTVNESMADYSETLWMEYKYGKDAGDKENYQGLSAYLSNPAEAQKELVRFKYHDKEDMFDLVSYQKGGRIQHMLRKYVGDAAYFKSLGNYLTTNKFKNGEAHQIRLAFEEVTGRDLNWFFNQWYFGSGHPIVKINYVYDDSVGKAKIIIEQTQKTDKVFKLPIAIDVYNGATAKRHNVWVQNKVDTFTFSYAKRPELINVDAEKIMLWQKTDNKTAENFVHQYKNAPTYLDRREALDFFAKKNMPELSLGLTDKFAPLKEFTLTKFLQAKAMPEAAVVKAIANIATAEKDKKAKAAAINVLVKTNDAAYLPIYKANVTDSSYTVAGAALSGLAAQDPSNAYALAKKYSTDAKGDLGVTVDGIIMENGTEADFDFIARRFDDAILGQSKFEILDPFSTYLSKLKNLSSVKKGVDMILKFRNAIPENYRNFTDPVFKQMLDKVAKAKGKEIEDYVGEKMK
jgi:aminopeptidase N